ncbi:restriction endonuclease subunit S [Arthrospira platensis BEA 1257B]
MNNSSWTYSNLQDLTESTITYGVVKPGMDDPSGVSFIRGGDITGHSIQVEKLRKISPIVSQQYKRTILQGGEILISLVGTIGQIAIVPNSLKGANIYRQIALVRLKPGIDTRFVRYFLLSPEGQNSLQSQIRGSVQNVINLKELKQVKVPLPPLDEQKAIAHILSTLDDKIELNQQMNRTLEAIARAIFKSWFIDFDPVRAKMDGRQPAGMDAETAALFPDEFEDSALGQIPKGWEVKTLSELANIESGKRPSERSSELTQYMKTPLFGGGGVMGYVKEPLYQKPILITGRVGTLGIVYRVSYPCWASDNTLVIIPKDFFTYEFLNFHLKEIRFDSLNRGSTQPLVTQGDLKKQNLAVSDEKILKIFHQITASFYQRCDGNSCESSISASIRDTLLPKLLSGEICVKDAEKVLEEVM